MLIRLARSVPGVCGAVDAAKRPWRPGGGACGGPGGGVPAGGAAAALKGQAQALQAALERHTGRPVPLLLAESKADQAQVWTVRKVGLGLIMSRPGDVRPYSFIEDRAVPVERLGEFVRGMERILAEHWACRARTRATSAGCLHIRPMSTLRLPKCGGSAQHRYARWSWPWDWAAAVSGEHGDGYARSEWYERMFGPR